MGRALTGIPITARLSKRDVAELERLSKVSGRNVGQVAAGVIREALLTRREARRHSLTSILEEIHSANERAGVKPISAAEAVSLVKRVRQDDAERKRSKVTRALTGKRR
jgi:hypothetical protein